MNHRRLLLACLLGVSLLGVAACGRGQPPDARGGPVPPANPPAANSPQVGQDLPAQAPATQNPSTLPADDEDGEFTILPAPADDEDGEFTILPAPVGGENDGSDPLVAPFRPVDEAFGNWDATGPDPVEVARQFALGSEPCDCDETSAVLFEEIGDHAVVEVVLTGLKDDSVRDRLYRVTLAKADGVWTVAAAEHQDTCHRGVGEGGLCT